MDDTEILTAILAELRTVAGQVQAIHDELEEFRPLLAMFRPGNGVSDLQRAGVLRALRRGARGPLAQALEKHGSLDNIPER